MTLTARHRISRRGIVELARDLFGVTLSTGSADAICQRASEALAGPHCQLQDRVLDDPPEAAFFQIAAHCNREQFWRARSARLTPGSWSPTRWNGYSHLEPN